MHLGVSQPDRKWCHPVRGRSPVGNCSTLSTFIMAKDEASMPTAFWERLVSEMESKRTALSEQRAAQEVIAQLPKLDE
jgi:hypothetical protein